MAPGGRSPGHRGRTGPPLACAEPLQCGLQGVVNSEPHRGVGLKPGECAENDATPAALCCSDGTRRIFAVSISVGNLTRGPNSAPSVGTGRTAIGQGGRLLVQGA